MHASLNLTKNNNKQCLCSLTQVPPCDNSDCIVLYGEQWRRGPEPTRLRSLRDPGRPSHGPGPHHFRTPILPNHLRRCHSQTYHNLWHQSFPYLGQLFIVTAGKEIRVVVSFDNAKQHRWNVCSQEWCSCWQYILRLIPSTLCADCTTFHERHSTFLKWIFSPNSAIFCYFQSF